MSENKITVLVVDDSAMMRIGLTQSMNVETNVNVVASAENSEKALAQFREHQPDIIIMDYQMPGESGVECTRRILAESPTAKIILFSVFETEEDIWNAVQAGVKGYLTKTTCEVEDLLEAIHEVAQGKTFFPAHIMRKLDRRKEKPELTLRELDVLRELAEGLSNQEIMDTLKISMSTVKMHITNIRSKLDAQDRTHAVVNACKQGILKLED